MRIKQYGLPRSGTNALKWVLEAYLGVTVLTGRGGSKHAPCVLSDSPESDTVAGIAVSVKDPYAWLTSMWAYCLRNPESYHADRHGFAGFLANPLGYPLLDGRLSFETPVHAWNQMNQHWLNITSRQVLAFRAEDLLAEEPARSALAKAAELWGIDWDGRLELPTGHMAAVGGVKRSLGDYPPGQVGQEFDREWYLDRRYLAIWTADLLASVTNRLDQGIMQALWYEPATAKVGA